MFRDLQRELRMLEGSISIPVEIELDDKGYVDRSCPSEECGTQFKILYEDWASLVREEIVFCPLCRHEADCTKWNTTEQSDYHRKLATSHIRNTIGNALRKDARRFNSKRSDRRSDSFIKVSMSYRPSSSPLAIPVAATDVMTQEFQCVECSCRYTSIGTAFFCPACGYNNIIETFSKTLQTVQKIVESIPALRQTFTELQDENTAADSVRHVLENSLCKIVASFQKYAETCFLRLPNSEQFKLRANTFQRLEQSNVIWQQATSRGYTDILNEFEYQKLNMYFQQRHLLEHQDGIIDQKYMERSKDYRFTIGQRLIVSDFNVSELASIIQKLSKGISNLK